MLRAVFPLLPHSISILSLIILLVPVPPIYLVHPPRPPPVLHGLVGMRAWNKGAPPPRLPGNADSLRFATLCVRRGVLAGFSPEMHLTSVSFAFTKSSASSHPPETLSKSGSRFVATAASEACNLNFVSATVGEKREGERDERATRRRRSHFYRSTLFRPEKTQRKRGTSQQSAKRNVFLKRVGARANVRLCQVQGRAVRKSSSKGL